MFILMLLKDVRSVAKAFKRVAKPAIDIVAIADQAAGYGFEIGRGQGMLEELTASPDNPFIHPNWREWVVPNER